jgi:hypothetical protein
LVELVTNTAGFCGLFLCPHTAFPQLPQSLLEPD